MGECSAIRVGIKTSGGLARFLVQRFDCDFFLLSHGHGSSRRFEGISLFLSSARSRAYVFSFKGPATAGPRPEQLRVEPSSTNDKLWIRQ